MAIEKTTAEPQPSFEEQMRQAEQDAGIPSDTEVYGEYMETPEVDEAGRLPASRPDEPEAVAEPEPEETPAEEPEPETEPEAEAEQPDQLAELNKKLGQLLNENAELRRQQEAAQQSEPQQAPQPLTDVTWFDELAEANPAQAATWALQNQQTYLYDRAVRTWYDQDPVAAGRFERYVENQDLIRNVQETFQPQIRSAQQLAQNQQMQEAMQTVIGRHPDFGEVIAGSTPDDIASIFADGPLKDAFEAALVGDDPKAKEQVFETIYAFKKSAAADHLVEAARELPARQNEEAREAKREAFVGSAATTTPDEVPMSEAERMAKAWAEDDRSLRSGWTGQDSRRSSGR